jgi:hypothetical protein
MGGTGFPMYVKASGKPVFDANGEFRGHRGTGTDVTATLRAQEAHERLRQLESDLAHMNRLSMIGELVASLAHEITQPITTARNNARAALNFVGIEHLADLECDLDRATQRIALGPDSVSIGTQKGPVATKFGARDFASRSHAYTIGSRCRSQPGNVDRLRAPGALNSRLRRGRQLSGFRDSSVT